MGQVITRCCALLFGLAVIWIGVDLAAKPYRETVLFRHAEPCAHRSVTQEASDCIGRETGRVTDKDTRTESSGTTDSETTTTVYELSIKRSSGKTETHEIDSALYDAARRGSRADLETWRGEVVGITVRGESDDLSPSSVGALTLSLLVAWAGAGLVLWSALGDGRFRGFPGGWMRTFAWMFLGLWTLAPAGYIVASGVGWETAVAVGFWLFGLAVIVPFFSDGRDGLRWSVGTRWRSWRGVIARR
jgi:hypothetical protein